MRDEQENYFNWRRNTLYDKSIIVCIFYMYMNVHEYRYIDRLNNKKWLSINKIASNSIDHNLCIYILIYIDIRVYWKLLPFY